MQEKIRETCEEHKRKTGNWIMNKDIWNGLKNKKIPFKVKDFIWKLIYNRHKVGNWFKRIPNWQDKAICECGKIETIDHILTEYKLNKSKDIWQEAKKMWEKNNKNFQWIKPNVRILRGLGAIKLREKEKLAPEWLNKRYIEIIMETTWMIWNIRNKRIFNNCHKLHSAISPPIIWRFSQSQWLWKALEKTFWLIPVTPQSDQYWLRY